MLLVLARRMGGCDLETNGQHGSVRRALTLVPYYPLVKRCDINWFERVRFYALLPTVRLREAVAVEKSPISNNVGGVKHVLSNTSVCTRRRAPFRSRSRFALSNLGSL